MVLTVQTLVSQHLLPGLKLLAGQSGSDNKICWVNSMDMLRHPESLQPGELLFTSGYGLSDQ